MFPVYAIVKKFTNEGWGKVVWGGHTGWKYYPEIFGLQWVLLFFQKYYFNKYIPCVEGPFDSFMYILQGYIAEP